MIDLETMRNERGAARFSGEEHGVDVSFIDVRGRVSEGPPLHVHPYPEVFVVVEGRVRFFLGENEMVLEAGQTVIGPAGLPHRFECLGSARLVNIHVAPDFITTWL